MFDATVAEASPNIVSEGVGNGENENAELENWSGRVFVSAEKVERSGIVWLCAEEPAAC